MTQTLSASILQKAARVRFLCLDVDGTLTDGKLYCHNGAMGRAFNVLDGLGVQRFARAVGGVAIITAAAPDEADGIRLRCGQMGVKHIHIGVSDKLAVVRQLMQAENLTAEQIAYIGDDLPDLEAMRFVGFAAAPQTAFEDNRRAATYIPALPAGAGAVREVCELIIAAVAAAAQATDAQNESP